MISLGFQHWVRSWEGARKCRDCLANSGRLTSPGAKDHPGPSLPSGSAWSQGENDRHIPDGLATPLGHMLGLWIRLASDQRVRWRPLPCP